MFDVLVYLYENYGALEHCPDASALSQKLAAAGFEQDDISAALSWLQELARVSRESVALDPPSARSFRVYSRQEVERLGVDGLAFLSCLDAAGQLSPHSREIILERALATGESPVALAKLKIIVLMVLWSQAADVDLLVLEELLDDGAERCLH